MAKMTGAVFVTSMDEVQPLILTEAGHIVAGDAVLHHAEGPCMVLARLGDHLMVEADMTLDPDDAAGGHRSG